MVDICRSHSISIRQYWLRVPKMQLGANRKRNPFQDNQSIFPVCTIRKAEHQRINAFKLWCWRRLLRVPLTARRSNQSILRERNPEYSLEGLLLKLKLQYFGHMMQKASSLEKTLMLGKIESKWRSRPQRIRWLDSITNSMDMNFSKLWETVEERKSWCATVHEVAESDRTYRLNNKIRITPRASECVFGDKTFERWIS